MLQPLHRCIWSDPEWPAHKLLRFGKTETRSGRELVRAAELTSDPLLRKLYLVHAEHEAAPWQESLGWSPVSPQRNGSLERQD